MHISQIIMEVSPDCKSVKQRITNQALLCYIYVYKQADNFYINLKSRYNHV